MENAGGATLEQDYTDRAVNDWRRERPDLDVDALEVIDRVTRLATFFRDDLEEALRDHPIGVPGYTVLAALRRSGDPWEMTPGELSRAVLLTTGAMTARLDRLESAGLVKRVRPETGDRRSIRIRLTTKGRRVIDEASADRMARAERALSRLGARERAAMTKSLRTLTLDFERR
ncbi:MAG: MarR family transcriptional regulator [Acidobacteriota bacterium]|nr:MarR family transcriptional regulator [Acidobacteriota bacterium]